MASLSTCCTSVGSLGSLRLQTTARGPKRIPQGVKVFDFHGPRLGLARRPFFAASKGQATSRRPGVVTCWLSRGEPEEDHSDVAPKLLAAKKTRALYATKLFIELPLVGLCALNVWAHWGDSVRAARGEPEYIIYALGFALFAGDRFFKLCWGDMVKLERAARDCFKLRRALPSGETEPHLGWDSEDEEFLAEQHERVNQEVLWGLAFEILLVWGLAEWNRVSPSPSDDKVLGRHMLLLGGSVDIVGEVVFLMCTCLALEGRKWAMRKWGN